MDDQNTTPSILIVDSQPSVTRPARDLLEIFDHNVYVAHSGEEALDHLQDHHEEIDLVILDLKMPDMHGAECLERIREIRPELPAILATGHVMEQDLKQRLAPKIQRHLSKPFTPTTLLKTIREVLADSS